MKESQEVHLQVDQLVALLVADHLQEEDHHQAKADHQEEDHHQAKVHLQVIHNTEDHHQAKVDLLQVTHNIVDHHQDKVHPAADHKAHQWAVLHNKALETYSETHQIL